MKNIRIFLSENFPFLCVKFSISLNTHVFILLKQFKRISIKCLSTLFRAVTVVSYCDDNI